MNFLEKIPAEWPLRLGLGLTYLYSGLQLFNQPNQWRIFLPIWFSGIISGIMPIETYLRLQGIIEIVMGLLFLAWFAGKRGVRIASAYMALEMAFILIFAGIDFITFRDIGLLAAAIALFLLVSSLPATGKTLSPQS